MAMMDTVRRLMAGRSAVVERSIDKAVDYLGRSSETLKRQAEVAKAKARSLDPDHPEGAPPGGASPSGTAPAGGTSSTATSPGTPPATPSTPPPTPPPAVSPPLPPSEPGATGLRGDLVDPPEEPPPA